MGVLVNCILRDYYNREICLSRQWDSLTAVRVTDSMVTVAILSKNLGHPGPDLRH